MTRTQWRRYHRQKKLADQSAPDGGNAKGVKVVEVARRPVKERISPPNVLHEKDKERNIEDEYMENEDDD
ncbi:hypothetical protein A2U01_0092303, partial [Trifolium medium]|nr:hypothetical protein [Trifolium medium]